MTAVGWTIRNRMLRNGSIDIAQVWSVYSTAVWSLQTARSEPRCKSLARLRTTYKTGLSLIGPSGQHTSTFLKQC